MASEQKPRVMMMTNGSFSCTEHQGCIERIKHLEEATKEQWSAIGKLNDKLDSIMMRVNIILGGLVVACVLLAINAFLETSIRIPTP